MMAMQVRAPSPLYSGEREPDGASGYSVLCQGVGVALVGAGGGAGAAPLPAAPLLSVP